MTGMCRRAIGRGCYLRRRSWVGGEVMIFVKLFGGR